MDSLLDHLRRLEFELQNPEASRDPVRLAELLHPDFREFGRSGGVYTRNDMLASLPLRTSPVRIHSQDFSLLELSPDVVLLTYRSAGLTAEGSARDYSHRVSIWKKGGMYWRIIFHQGTAVEAFELVA